MGINTQNENTALEERLKNRVIQKYFVSRASEN